MTNAALVAITLPKTHKSGSALAPTDISVVNIFRADGDAAAVNIGTIANPQTAKVSFTDHSAVEGVEYGYTADCVTPVDGEGEKSDVFPFEIPEADPATAPTITGVTQVTV